MIHQRRSHHSSSSAPNSGQGGSVVGGYSSAPSSGGGGPSPYGSPAAPSAAPPGYGSPPPRPPSATSSPYGAYPQQTTQAPQGYSGYSHQQPNPQQGYAAAASSTSYSSGGVGSVATDSNNPFRYSKKSSFSSQSKRIIFTMLVIVVLPICYGGYKFYSIRSQLMKQYKDLENKKKTSDEKQRKLREELHTNIDTNKKLNKEIATMSGEIQKMKRAGHGGGQHRQGPNQVMQRQQNEAESERKAKERRDREAAMQVRVNMLQRYIRERSKREVYERFGPGPHRIKFTVQVQESPESRRTVIRFFTIMTTRIDWMPHSIHVFLEQVHHGLWNGCTFVLNEKHILQASPTGGDGQPEQGLLYRFEEKNLGALSFQEYDKRFPHRQYTVGFSGRPGGPDFYINLMDNKSHHGPGGQMNVDLPEEADPCFARIVEGMDTIELMKQQKTLGDGKLARRILILRAAILTASNRGVGSSMPVEEEEEDREGETMGEVEVNEGGGMQQQQEEEDSASRRRAPKRFDERKQRMKKDRRPEKIMDPDYCGSCYGAGEEGQCCNTCEELKEAYQKNKWGVDDLVKEAEQCIGEETDDAVENEAAAAAV